MSTPADSGRFIGITQAYPGQREIGVLSLGGVHQLADRHLIAGRASLGVRDSQNIVVGDLLHRRRERVEQSSDRRDQDQWGTHDASEKVQPVDQPPSLLAIRGVNPRGLVERGRWWSIREGRHTSVVGRHCRTVPGQQLPITTDYPRNKLHREPF